MIDEVKLKLSKLGEHVKDCKYCFSRLMEISTHMATGKKVVLTSKEKI